MKWNLLRGDCIERMEEIKTGSVDMVMTDPPYGITACKWDSVIPLDKMWKQLKRLIKSNGAIVLMAGQPFTSALVMSNPKMFKYEWIWFKDKGGNIGVLKYQPSKVHESICVFSITTHGYWPIMDQRLEKNKRRNKPRWNKSNIQGTSFYTKESKGNRNVKYPVSIRKHNTVRGSVHPTQKPVALMEYMIRTYTNEGETVLDFTMGSGTTGVACRQLNRNFIGIELDKAYFRIAKVRIQEARRQ